MLVYVGIIEARHGKTLIGDAQKIESQPYVSAENAAQWVAGQRALNLAMGKSVLGARIQAKRVKMFEVHQCGDMRSIEHPDNPRRIVRQF